MSLSGIGVSPELTEAFSQAVDSEDIRFLKVSINKDPLKLVPDGSVNVTGSLLDDFNRQDQKNVLQLEENVPAYILARDEQSNGWLAIYYMPESNVAQFNRMVYSTTRNTLTKSLGSSLFTGSPEVFSRTEFASSYNEYVKTKKDPGGAPLTAMEREIAEIRAAEREAAHAGNGSGGAYVGGNSVRQNHLGTVVGLKWQPEVEEAVRVLAEGDGSRLVVISIDTVSETLVLTSAEDINADQVGSSLPASEPSFSLFAWAQASTARQIIFIYSCPSSSPVKYRMLYSSGAIGAFITAKNMITSSSSVLASRKIETSDPKEIDEAYLRDELSVGAEGGRGSGPGSGAATPLRDEEKKAFARPKGPGRKR